MHRQYIFGFEKIETLNANFIKSDFIFRTKMISLGEQLKSKFDSIYENMYAKSRQSWIYLKLKHREKKCLIHLAVHIRGVHYFEKQKDKIIELFFMKC